VNPTEPSPDPAALRAVLGRFATGVAVVTAMTADGPVGMTVNSFSSVSLDPPLVLFCVRRESVLRAAFVSAPGFAVNVLRADQQGLSRRFAAPGTERFAALPSTPAGSRPPVLEGALAVIECLTRLLVPAGDHEIVIGQVTRAAAGTGAEPLVFYRGTYRTLALA
jgi:3-hydroxy-9,10-secoandrosta-1,3,5(10)-triene-9,17-dione monooxygenase reductase component